MTCSSNNKFEQNILWDGTNLVRDITYYCNFVASTSGGNPSVVSQVDSFLCNQTLSYYLKYGNNTHHLSEIKELINKTYKEYGLLYYEDYVKRYISNWLEICSGKVSCETKINRVIFGWDMDNSVGFFKIEISSCKLIQTLKWIFRIEEKDGLITYEINGLKLWWIILIILFSLIPIVYKLNKIHRKTLENAKNHKNRIKRKH